MFVELPVEEAYASLYQALQRLAVVLAAALIFAVLAGMFLARRMVGPIQALRAGAERIGGGDFAQRISIKTGDELEGLANQFNDMGARLQESYADLENKVETRTSELSESLQHQTATSEVLQVISRSPGDLNPVFQTILQSATRICDAKFGLLLLFQDGNYRRASVFNLPPAFAESFEHVPVISPPPSDPLGRLAATHRVIHVADVRQEPDYRAGLSADRQPGGTRRRADAAAGADAKENALVGVIAIFRQRGSPVRGQAGRPGDELCQPGGDRHRECAAVERAAPAHRRSQRVAAAADRDRRSAEGDQPLGVRPAGGVRHPDHLGGGAARRHQRHHLRARRRRVSLPGDRGPRHPKR